MKPCRVSAFSTELVAPGGLEVPYKPSTPRLRSFTSHFLSVTALPESVVVSLLPRVRVNPSEAELCHCGGGGVVTGVWAWAAHVPAATRMAAADNCVFLLIVMVFESVG